MSVPQRLGFRFLYARYTAYENMSELAENKIRMRSSGLSLKRHLRENEKLALHPYILHNLLAEIMMGVTSVVHVWRH